MRAPVVEALAELQVAGNALVESQVVLEGEGFGVTIIYHSHVDVGAYFSETDRRMAMMGQDPRRHDPLYPEVTHVVMAVTRDRVEQVNAFRWNPTTRDFPPVEPGVTVSSERGA